MKPSEEAYGLQRLFTVGHAAAAALVFLPPLPLAIALANGVDVRFWVGHIMLLPVAAAVVALALPAFGTLPRPTGGFLSGSVWVPAALIAAGSFACRLHASSVAGELQGPECFVSTERRNLYEAYAEADALYSTCLGLLAQAPGRAPPLMGVADCPQYPEASKRWGRQFEYLAALERRFPCANACYGGRRLWEDPGVLAPSCAPFAAQSLRASAAWSTVLIEYSAVVVLVNLLLHCSLLAPLVRRFEEVAF
uniref:Uncharacterized protein n=1 Tax=Zooxanthella nutricula TaxID=1333877 RepID=A0A7S2IUQ5_9DINO